ncbi:MAG TPA: Na+/H+ antiporter NhaA [Streptosporangiaceae bacterium]|nr:Na+/H+ antiporter NhaA [Streptosporangiaceae bacterium]
MTDERPPAPADPFSGRTAWARSLETPLRVFLRTETGSAAVLAAMTVAALAWVNISASSYESVWATHLSVRLGGVGVSLELRDWVNSGLMTFFFFIFGLEARREFDMGELRERRRLALPVAAGLGGLLVPVAIYLAFNAGSAARGWGAAMSTDTAFALGMLALTRPRFPDRVRAFLLSVAVVDDLVSLVVIGAVYSRAVKVVPLATAAGILAIVALIRRAGVRYGIVYAVLGAAAWVAVLKSGVDPVVVGLVMGLSTYAYPAARTDLERASDLFRSFREQPTPELARSAGAGLAGALSPNERLQLLYHPWTSYVIVPLFALANAGIVISGSFLAAAYTSPVTLGILLGYVAGKPAGIAGSSWLLTRLGKGRLRPPVGWAAVAGTGTIAGIGFTVSILIATLAFTGRQLQEAKLGVLSTTLAATLITWLVFRATALLPSRLQIRALLGSAEAIIDLGPPVDPGRDHIRGPASALVTIVEYGDFECPYCGQAEPAVRELLAGHGDVRYVWRHLPLNDVHPHAQLAAEAAEAAADQDAFWPMHDLLLRHQDALLMRDLIGYASDAGIDIARFRDYLTRRGGAARIAEDVDSADLSGVSGTPTFFINDRRHYGSYDITALTSAVQAAKAAALRARSGPQKQPAR